MQWFERKVNLYEFPPKCIPEAVIPYNYTQAHSLQTEQVNHFDV